MISHPIDPSCERDLISAALVAEPDRHGADLDAAIRLVRDVDLSDATLRRVWQAVRDAWESDRCVDVGRIRLETRVPSELLAGLLSAAASPEVIRDAAHRVALDGVLRLERDAARRLATGSEADAAVARSELEALSSRRMEIDDARSGGRVHVWDASSDIGEPDPPPEELVERMLVRPGIAIVYGPPSSGKSYAVLAACADLVMGGGAFAGVELLQVRPRRSFDTDEIAERVLWIYGSEDTRRRMKRRVRQILEHGPHAGKTLPGGAFVYGQLPAGTMLNTPRGLAWLREEIRRRQATVVVLDTVASVCGDSLDVNDNGAVCSFMLRMHRVRDDFGVALWLLHHSRKGSSDPKDAAAAKADAALGAGQWRAQTDTMVGLEAIDGDTRSVSLRVVKAKDIDVPPPVIRLTQDPASARFRELVDDEEAPVRVAAPREKGGRPPAVTAEAVLALREAHPEGLEWNCVHEALGIGRSTWFRARSEIQSDLLGRGAVVVGGMLRWTTVGSERSGECHSEKSTSQRYEGRSKSGAESSRSPISQPTSESTRRPSSSGSPLPSPSTSVSASAGTAGGGPATSFEPRPTTSGQRPDTSDAQGTREHQSRNCPETLSQNRFRDSQGGQSRNPSPPLPSEEGGGEGSFGTGSGLRGAVEADGEVSGLDGERWGEEDLGRGVAAAGTGGEPWEEF